MADIRNKTHWEWRYQNNEPEVLPWYNPELDSDLKEELKKRGISSGSFLDLGTGSGSQANELYKLGFRAAGTDISPTAVKKASLLYPGVSFIVDDILDTHLTGCFDYILDKGCFHVFEPSKRPLYSSNIKKLSKPGTILFLKCMSGKEPDGKGPFRIPPKEIRETFKKGFHIESIKESYFIPYNHPIKRNALFCAIKVI
ncbi:MAG: class I SAM-dependent methyltransferase [Candidatus Goldiibacteriota bacterium]